MRHMLRRRRGAVLVLIAISLVVLLGVTALVLDGGLLFDLRRTLQATADASALCAALDMGMGKSVGTATADANRSPVTISRTSLSPPLTYRPVHPTFHHPTHSKVLLR